MRLNFKISLFFSLLGISVVYGQQNVKPLTVGDSLPDFRIPKIINSEKGSIMTSAYKDKLLILDFWSTKCPSCIAGMPRMESLQKRFGSKIIILPVTYEKTELIVPFWKKNNYTKGLSLPTVVEDKLFDAYFPHHGVPFEVWIFKGKVIGITSPNYVDVQNIQRVLNGERVNWAVRNDFYKFDQSKPLFQLIPSLKSVGNNISQYYTIVGGYRPKVNYSGSSGGRGIIRDTVNKTIRIYWLNEPIYYSYIVNFMSALGRQKLVKPTVGLDSNQVIWEVRDRSKYRFHNKYIPYLQEWIINNGYCFESVYPDSGQSDPQIYQRATYDLNKLLGLKVRWEKRKEKVWVLKEKIPGKAFLSKNGKPGSGITLNSLVNIFNDQEDHCYVFNETKKLEERLMDIKVSPSSDLNVINSVVAPYGLTMVEQEKEVDKLVFTEINGGLLNNRVQSARAKRIGQKNMENASAEENSSFLKNNKTQPAILTLPSGLQYKILQPGNGRKPTLNDKVQVHYSGMQVNGKILDSSYERGKPAEFQVSSVIKGWQEALQLMQVGSKWILYIPSELAYSSHTAKGRIPPNSTLIFEIELLGITTG